MKFRKHLSYANVTATLALVLALGTGVVYAAGEIGSREIANNGVRTQDLKDRRGVTGEDVRRNSLGNAEIDEASLLSIQGEQEADCDPPDATYVDCASKTIDLASPSQLLVIATGGFASETNGARADCEVRVDGQDQPLSERPGEVNDNTDTIHTDGFARTLVTGRLTRGTHTIALACQQLGAPDARINAPTIAAIAVTAD